MKKTIDSPLQALFQLIAQAQSENVLKQTVMVALGEYFAAHRWRLWFLDQLPMVTENAPDLLKRAVSLDDNPVLRYVVQNHAVVHDEAILPPGVWKTLCPRADHGHVMLGPIIKQGQLAGGIALTRHRDHQAFNADNVADLSALCLHFSTRLAVLWSTPGAVELDCIALTPREAQIAGLVAQGLTNKAIGEALWITENSVKQALKRMFRKLKVASRAEMVAHLSAAPTGRTLPQTSTV